MIKNPGISAGASVGDASGRLIGAHMPTAGGIDKSIARGVEIGCSAIQIFTANPRQWKQPPLADETIVAFRTAREHHAVPFLASHDSYLINLASPDPEILARSCEAFLSELRRAHQLDIRWVVTHMGAYMEDDESIAVDRLIQSLRSILDTTDEYGCTAGIALETTAGQGTGLGATFEQIGAVLAGVGLHPRIGVCLDTCHVFAAGYELRDESGYEETIASFDALVGLSNLRLIHANDSKKGRGSRVDRHEHIGSGEIGDAAFRRIVRDPRLSHVPMIVETPDAETMHQANLGRLRHFHQGKVPVHVQFFAHFTDRYGSAPIEHTVDDCATVADLVEMLAERDPEIARMRTICRYARNDAYCDGGDVLQYGDTVAVLPPMSGG